MPILGQYNTDELKKMINLGGVIRKKKEYPTVIHSETRRQR